MEDDLRQMIGRVQRGTLSRRGFVRRMAALGVTAPMASSRAWRGPRSAPSAEGQ